MGVGVVVVFREVMWQAFEVGRERSVKKRAEWPVHVGLLLGQVRLQRQGHVTFSLTVLERSLFTSQPSERPFRLLTDTHLMQETTTWWPKSCSPPSLAFE